MNRLFSILILSLFCTLAGAQTQPSAANIVINEILPCNVDVYLDPSMNYGSCVELYNPTDRDVSIGGLYVSDTTENLQKHHLREDYGYIPAHGYQILNFDHFEIYTPWAARQIDDNLNSGGGTIIISDGTNIIARQDYPALPSRISYARTSDGGEEWGKTGCPSIGFSNSEYGGFASDQLQPPLVDTYGKRFTDSFQLRVAFPTEATLRYTTDGTTPTMTNGNTSYDGVFDVNSTVCYRFRLFQDGLLPSSVVTRSYIKNNNYHFPIISVVTDPDNIYDTDRGLFQKGQYGRPGNGQSSNCNWNMDWDRPVSFEFITSDNECVVAQECDMAMCGGWSRAWTPHSFKLKAKKQYDLMNTFDYQFFTEKPFLRHKTLQIRNGGNDTSNRIKDVGIQQIVARSGMRVDYQAWQPVHVFINGSHYAVLNMREPNNKDFAYANYGIDTDEMDQFEISPDSGYVQKRGTREGWEQLVTLSENADDPDTYEEIRKRLDIDEFINYMAVELYAGNYDWPRNNVKAFCSQDDGKFHFVLFDLDGSLSTKTPITDFFAKENWTFNALLGYDYYNDVNINGVKYRRQIDMVTLFKNMLQNKTFRKQFIDTYCIVGGAVFRPAMVETIINDVRNTLSEGGFVNPSGTANSIISGFGSNYNLTLVNHLKNTSQMKLTGTTPQKASISANISDAIIELNGLNVPYGQFDGYLLSPATLKAVAPAGYVFKGWKDPTSLTRNENKLIVKGDTWWYYDQGSLDGTDWKTKLTSGWQRGQAPFGYNTSSSNNESIYNTILNYGNDRNHKYPTYYFSFTVNLPKKPSDDDIMQLDYSCDDGFILYVNGIRAASYLMPAGDVTFNSYSTTYAPSGPDNGTINLPLSVFKSGMNTIAVEVHNNSASSSDIYWDAALTWHEATDTDYPFVSKSETLPLQSNGNINVKAYFEKMTAKELVKQGVHPVVINEISAANTVAVNEYFKKNDWIELYNTTDDDIDIAGMYVSDKIDKPTKYRISEATAVDAHYSTIIPAHGFLVLWADQLDPAGYIHTGFKLGNNENEVVMLTAADESWTDTLIYTVQKGDESFGLYPDGTKNTYVMNFPTIGAANRLDSYGVSYEGHIDIPVPDGFTNISDDENSVSMTFGNDQLTIVTSNPASANLQIFNSSGQIVNDMNITVSDMTRIPVSDLPSGIYIARIVSEFGYTTTVKFIKK